MNWLQGLDRGIGTVCAAAAVLALPVSALLFLQWPLREVVQSYSREANDLAQLLFALYVSVAVTYASRRRTHLGTDILARRYPRRLRAAIQRLANLLIVLPWSAFVLWSGGGMVIASVGMLESFPETYNPGYFMVKAAMGLLALLALLQALVALTQANDDGPG